MNTYHRASNWKNKSVDHFFLNVLMFSLRSVSNPTPTRMCSTYLIANIPQSPLKDKTTKFIHKILLMLFLFKLHTLSHIVALFHRLAIETQEVEFRRHLVLAPPLDAR